VRCKIPGLDRPLNIDFFPTGASVIRDWLSRTKEQEIGRKAILAASGKGHRTLRSLLSSDITRFCTLENLTWLAVVVGVLLRVLDYADFRDLYLDERNLLHNLTDLAVFDFRTKLSEDQLAAPGFLVVERLLVRLPLNPILAATN
jgi:hypothetical protein